MCLGENSSHREVHTAPKRVFIGMTAKDAECGDEHCLVVAHLIFAKEPWKVILRRLYRLHWIYYKLRFYSVSTEEGQFTV